MHRAATVFSLKYHLYRWAQPQTSFLNLWFLLHSHCCTSGWHSQENVHKEASKSISNSAQAFWLWLGKVRMRQLMILFFIWHTNDVVKKRRERSVNQVENLENRQDSTTLHYSQLWEHLEWELHMWICQILLTVEWTLVLFVLSYWIALLRLFFLVCLFVFVFVSAFKWTGSISCF